MKKFFAVLLMATLFAPAVAIAADEFTAEPINATDPRAGLISTLSNNVTMSVASGGNTYAAASGHASGNKVFASTSADTKIYVKVEDPVAMTSEVTESTTGQFVAGDTWSAL